MTSDAQQTHQVLHLVLLVSVVPALRFIEQTETVMVADGVHRRVRRLSKLASAPRHVVSLPRSRGVRGASTSVRRHIRLSSAAMTPFRVVRSRQGNSRSSIVTS